MVDGMADRMVDGAGAVLPWARPVRLLHVDGPACGGDEVGQDARWDVVTIGVPVSGVGRVAVRTALVDGIRAVTDLVQDAGARDASHRGTLALLLDGLADAQGAVPVLTTGTALRAAVLRALRDVPLGTTRTYTELARAAGAPRAVRAAAHVMATNRVPLLLPCHRIVPAAGGTGRYGWGAEVKAGLLAMEAAAAGRRRVA